ncbi:hypothetical protein CHLRE_15g643392v5 [Chlamydomonas reinhardtii]|uniref:Uncharacterized protein n=1 Tax=Chlamydomonas reinhardtii TaxID=3055 RepID=A0A2K3CX27_CHLRE|nr:uncharacterized protein CHLRE_15g643392v5 [Chlamydomonas reinhardtii]PNW72819.1 hypothetical protein CHLRE_15g643392v5 [Chlamydomonas reinhardtii]
MTQVRSGVRSSRKSLVEHGAGDGAQPASIVQGLDESLAGAADIQLADAAYAQAKGVV